MDDVRVSRAGGIPGRRDGDGHLVRLRRVGLRCTRGRAGSGVVSGSTNGQLHPTGLSAADDSRCSGILSRRGPGPAVHDSRLTNHLRRRLQGHLRSSLAVGPEARSARVLDWTAHANDAYPPIQGRVLPGEVLVQFTAGGLMSGEVHTAVRHSKLIGEPRPGRSHRRPAP